jgi:hypothetical protein
MNMLGKQEKYSNEGMLCQGCNPKLNSAVFRPNHPFSFAEFGEWISGECLEVWLENEIWKTTQAGKWARGIRLRHRSQLIDSPKNSTEITGKSI